MLKGKSKSSAACSWVGAGEERQLLRLVQVLYRGKWYRYLTNEVDAERLPTEYVVAMVYRSLYFFSQAVQRGEATDLAYLIANVKPLGLLKRKRKRLSLELLQSLTNASP